MKRMMNFNYQMIFNKLNYFFIKVLYIYNLINMSLVCYGIKKCYDRMSGKAYYKVEYEREDANKKVKDFLSLLVNLFAGVIAATIAWNRNANEGMFVQILVSVLAFFFGILYLIYFAGFVLMDSSLFKKTYLLDIPKERLKVLADEAEKLAST